jgi:hypothetical protein
MHMLYVYDYFALVLAIVCTAVQRVITYYLERRRRKSSPPPPTKFPLLMIIATPTLALTLTL